MAPNKIIFSLLLIMIALPAVSFAAPAGKVTLCHVPPGNPDNAHAITISENAYDTHVNKFHGNGENGDYVLGEGQECKGPSGAAAGPAIAGDPAAAVQVCSAHSYSKGRAIGLSNLGRVQQDNLTCN
jgi:hypothetical protein